MAFKTERSAFFLVYSRHVLSEMKRDEGSMEVGLVLLSTNSNDSRKAMASAEACHRAIRGAKFSEKTGAGSQSAVDAPRN